MHAFLALVSLHHSCVEIIGIGLCGMAWYGITRLVRVVTPSDQAVVVF